MTNSIQEKIKIITNNSSNNSNSNRTTNQVAQSMIHMQGMSSSSTTLNMVSSNNPIINIKLSKIILTMMNMSSISIVRRDRGT